MRRALGWMGVVALGAAAIILFVWVLVVWGQGVREGRTTYSCENTTQSTFVCVKK